MSNCQQVQKPVFKSVSKSDSSNGRVLDSDQIYLIDLSVSLVLIMTMALAYIIVWVWFLSYKSGACLPDGHFVRIPHGAVKRRRPSGRRTPLYITFI